MNSNTKHIVKPNWIDLYDSTVTILVDDGNNGSIDDTLILVNQLTGVETQGSLLIPDEYRLEQNYPNPFNPSTTLKYEIPKESYITLKVYDILGREVATLVNKEQKAGYYEVDWNAVSNSSGVYFYRIQAGEFVETKKMVLLR